MGERTALLIYTSQQDAQTIRERAALDHRTVSGYLLNILLRAVAFEEILDNRLGRLGVWGLPSRPAFCPPGPKTTMLLRCSREQGQSIRSAARRRNTSISAFVRDTLRRSWKAESEHRPLIHPVLSDGGVAVQFPEQQGLAVSLAPSAHGLNRPVTGGTVNERTR